MAANLINKSIRSDFEVFILPNLYGDIITDEAAHGSAPFLIETGMAEYADPTSIFTAVCMMLTHIGYGEKAEHLKRALENAIRVKPDEIKASVFTDIVLESI
jgi:isocitrate/isopropylmalate dehydrogenase